MVDLVRRNLPEIEELCRKHRVRRLFLIGSALREDFDPARSDVDFVVDFFPTDEHDAYFQLLADMKKLLGREVDLIEGGRVRNPVVRASMEHARVPLYDAA